jgi:hypothetical protein
MIKRNQKKIKIKKTKKKKTIAHIHVMIKRKNLELFVKKLWNHDPHTQDCNPPYMSLELEN